MPTLAEVAKLAGVGVMSVSRVVNGTRRVSPEVEHKVRLAIEQIGYVPNEAARILKGNRSSVIGLILPDLADPFFAELGHAVQQRAWEAGYMTLMAASDHREELEAREAELMVRHRVAGLIAVAVGTSNDHFSEVQQAGIPIVAIDRPIRNLSCDTLTVNNRHAACEATMHLVEHGHERILCVADTERIHTKHQRVAGYKTAIRRAGLQPMICLVDPETGELAAQLDRLLNGPGRATAIFAESNVVATAVLHEMQRRALRIPDDIALLCFDDFSAATLTSPMISVVQQPVADLGRTGASMLLDRLSTSENSSSTAKHLELQTSLVIRGSCGTHSVPENGSIQTPKSSPPARKSPRTGNGRSRLA